MGFALEEIELMESLSFDISLLEILLNYKDGVIREISPPQEMEYSDILNIKGIAFEIIQGRSNATYRYIQKSLKDKGYQVYFSELNDNLNQLNTISIIKSYDELDIIRFNNVNGVNHNILTTDIIDKIKIWKNLYGLDITGANNDWIMFKLHTLPAGDLLDLYVDELIEFCPDYLYQDNYATRGIEWRKFMIRSIIFYNKIVRLWWD